MLPSLDLRAAAHIIVISAISVALAVQTVRIEWQPLKLPLIGAIGPEGFKAQLARQERELTSIDAAQKLALFKAQQAKARAEADYRKAATEHDNALQTARAEVRDSVERFIAAGGVQHDTDGRCRSTPESPDRSAGELERMRSAAELDAAEPVPAEIELRAGSEQVEPRIVRVLEEDVRICTDNTLRLEKAREWALAIEAVSEAD